MSERTPSGLSGSSPKTPSVSQFSASALKISNERIRQIESRIRKRLKQHLTQTLGTELDFEFDVPVSD